MTAAGDLLGTLQGALQAQTAANGALEQVSGAIQAAQGAFAASGGTDKINLLAAISEKHKQALASGAEALTAIQEEMRLAGIVAEGTGP